MSRKRITDTRSALKTKPRAPGCTGNLSARAASNSRGGSVLDMRNSSLAKLSGSAASADGNSIGQRLCGGDVGVEQQHVAVRAGQLLQRLGSRQRIAVGGHAVGDVDDQRRIAGGEATEENLQVLLGQFERLAHGRSAGGLGLEPDGELERLFEDAAGAVIDLARPLLDAQRIVGDGADGHQGLAGQVAAQRRDDAAAVADDADVEVIADAVGLGALEDEILQQAIDGVGDALGLLLVGLAAERLQHGAGLIDEEDETGGIGAV